MREKKIALLLDVDNVKISSEAFDELYEKVCTYIKKDSERKLISKAYLIPNLLSNAIIALPSNFKRDLMFFKNLSTSSKELNSSFKATT